MLERILSYIKGTQSNFNKGNGKRGGNIKGNMEKRFEKIGMKMREMGGEI